LQVKHKAVQRTMGGSDWKKNSPRFTGH